MAIRKNSVIYNFAATAGLFFLFFVCLVSLMVCWLVSLVVCWSIVGWLIGWLVCRWFRFAQLAKGKKFRP